MMVMNGVQGCTYSVPSRIQGGTLNGCSALGVLGWCPGVGNLEAECAWSEKVAMRMILEVMPLEVAVAASAFTPNGTK